MQLISEGSIFRAVASFDERHAPKQAGFRWNPDRKIWWTDDVEKAARLAQFADATARARIDAEMAQKKASLQASRAASADIDLPVPEGLAYLPYQRAGIAYAMGRSGVLIGDEMGLGKTIQAIGVMNCTADLRRAIVVCPASLRLNWKREIEKWMTHSLTVGVAEGKDWPATDIVVINYDILKNHADRIAATEWDLCIWDEAHYMKNGKAQRTMLGLSIKARRRIALTGTPIPNRPIEAWTILNALDPNTFKSRGFYAKRYCNGHNNGWGWDESGASNLDELQDKLRSSIMVRRMKADVLKELPAKVRQIVELPANGASAIIAREAAALAAKEAMLEGLRVKVELAKAESDEAYAAAAQELADASTIAFSELSKLRHEVAMAKVPYVIEHLNEALADGRKIVCFAHHKDVIAALRAAFPGAVSITGDTAMADRQAAVDAFQRDPNVKLFLGNIMAAGVGLTLTASSHVVFAELDWVPGNVTQAEDRCHRIGQKDSVLVQHIVLDGSMDARLVHTIVAKQAVIDSALDTEHDRKVVPVTLDPAQAAAPATKAVKPSKFREEGLAMTVSQVAAVHRALRLLSGMDSDGAQQLNGVGFNRLDTLIGNDLASRPSLTPAQAALGRRIAQKYHKQVGLDLVAAMK